MPAPLSQQPDPYPSQPKPPELPTDYVQVGVGSWEPVDELVRAAMEQLGVLDGAQ